MQVKRSPDSPSSYNLGFKLMHTPGDIPGNKRLVLAHLETKCTHTHTHILRMIGAAWGEGTKAMIKGEKRQKNSIYLFNSIYILVCSCPSLYWDSII